MPPKVVILHKLKTMKYKFENLDVWKISLQLQDKVDPVIRLLPEYEKYNLASQLRRATTSVSLNIAEGSTSVSNAEQSRFLGISIRSLIEVIACIRLIEHRNYLDNKMDLLSLHKTIDALFIKLQAFRRSLG